MANEAIVGHEPGCVKYITPVALASGQVIQLPDGRAGYYGALKAAAVGDLVTIRVEGIVTIPKTTSMVILTGSRIFWDYSANKGHLLHGSDRDFFAGAAIGDYAAGATTMKINLNVKPVFTAGLDSGFISVPVLTAGFPFVAGNGEGANLAFSATAEVQKVDALSARAVAVAESMIAEALIVINNQGDAAALDLNIGVANGTHASNADSITESLFVHVDGNALDLLLESDDGTTEVNATDSTVDAVAGTPFLVQWDLRDLEDIQVYINGVLMLPSSVFKLNAATGPLRFLAHMEKTSDDTPGNVSVLYGGIRQFQAAA